MDKHASETTQVAKGFTIESETIFTAAMSKLGLKEHKIHFEVTHDHKYFAILEVEMSYYPYTESPKKTTIYSYFHDTTKEAREDVYTEAVNWLQTEHNLILDIKANQQLKETQHRLQASTTMASIIEDKYTKTKAEAARININKEQAMAEMLATAQKMPKILALAENTTPMKPKSRAYPHMVYMGQDLPTNEKEELAKCLCEVYTLLKLA